MRKRIAGLIALSLLLGASSTLVGQSFGLTISGGLASSRMNDMKYLQEHILSTYPVPGKITSSFPPFTSVTISGFKQLYDHIRVGGAYSYTTTGGKSSYADYSGNISNEITAMSHRLGAYISYRVLGGNRLDLSLNGRMDANITSLTIQSYYEIYTYYNGVSNNYRSISPSASVEAELMYNLKGFSLGMNAGYLADLAGELKDVESGNALLDPNDPERTLVSDWTGWYIQLKAQIWLKF